MSQKVGKVHNFDLPQDVLDFFEIGKNGNLMFPPLDLLWEKFEIRKILNFGNPPQNKKQSLKNQLIFCLTGAFKVYIYILEKPENTDSPPPIKKSRILILDFLIFGADPPFHLINFFHFL